MSEDALSNGNAIMASNNKTPAFTVSQESNGKEAPSGDYLSISEFYNGRGIFITGGTGFMGKVSKHLEIFIMLFL